MQEINEDYLTRQKEDGWPGLTAVQKALAFAYVQNAYSVKDAAKEIKGITTNKATGFIALPLMQYYIAEIAHDREMCTIVTKHFITSQYLKMLPMVFGEEAIPIVLPTGQAIEAEKFNAAGTVAVLKELSNLQGIRTEESDIVKVFKVELSEAD